MQKLLGLVIILACIIGGYLEAGGRLIAFWQPGEILIICGAGIGATVIANSRHMLKEIFHQIKLTTKKNTFTEEYQRQILMLLYELLELVQTGGIKSLDEHVEVPEDSALFQKYQLILQDKSLITFISDNFRLMAMGKINEHELDAILEQELAAMEEELLQASRSLQRTGEAMPGFGICAAVLGIIIAMQSIDGSIAVIGLKVAAALIGTFLGVFICYCLLDPLSNSMAQTTKKSMAVFECVRTVLVSHVSGKPTLLAVDAGRKMLPLNSKPSFARLDKWVEQMME